MAKNYDPKREIFVFKGIQARGFAKGTFIEASRTKETFSMESGAGGDVVFVKSADRTGKVKVTLQAESPTNDQWSAIAIADEAGLTVNAGLGEIMMKNLNSGTVIVGPESRISKIPDLKRADSAGNVEWEFIVADISMFLGGALA